VVCVVICCGRGVWVWVWVVDDARVGGGSIDRATRMDGVSINQPHTHAARPARQVGKARYGEGREATYVSSKHKQRHKRLHIVQAQAQAQVQQAQAHQCVAVDEAHPREALEQGRVAPVLEEDEEVDEPVAAHAPCVFVFVGVEDRLHVRFAIDGFEHGPETHRPRRRDGLDPSTHTLYTHPHPPTHRHTDTPTYQARRINDSARSRARYAARFQFRLHDPIALPPSPFPLLLAPPAAVAVEVASAASSSSSAHPATSACRRSRAKPHLPACGSISHHDDDDDDDDPRQRHPPSPTNTTNHDGIR
jgi:hypothetical protein